jgi:F-type H+-transporting ATPase subunit gamma
MATLKTIRKRISSVRNIQQITKAMKMVSAARLRRAQEAAFAARPYAEKLEAVLQNLAAQFVQGSRPLGDTGTRRHGDTEQEIHPFLVQREENRVHLLLITSDRGLCGSYNTNLIRTAETFVREREGQKVSFTIIGRKGFEYFRRRRATIAEHHINLFGRFTPMLAQEIGRKMGERLIREEVEGVYILYSRFRSALSQIPTLERLLPIVARKETEISDRDRPSLPPSVSVPVSVSLEYLYEPATQELITSLLERYVNMLVYRAMLEGAASEHGARMTAMDNATSNAVEMISRLTLDMNRARQAAITKELLEIVSTGEALRA